MSTFLLQLSYQWLGPVTSITSYTIATFCPVSTSKMHKTKFKLIICSSRCVLWMSVFHPWHLYPLLEDFSLIPLTTCCLGSPLITHLRSSSLDSPFKLLFVSVFSSASLLPTPNLGPSSSLLHEWSDRCLALLMIQWKSRNGAGKGG